MGRLQMNKQKKQFQNKLNYFQILCICFFISTTCDCYSQSGEVFIDRFYKTVDSILECKKEYSFIDTISFSQKALYSYRNNQVYFYFNSFFKCHEPRYENKLSGNGGVPTIPIKSTYGLCDKRYILLFYIENYLLANIIRKSPIPKKINVYSIIYFKNIKSGKLTEMGVVNDYKNLNKIYNKLLKIYNNKALIKKIIYEKKMTPLEFIGYKWVIE